ncbi:MAG: response regulator transcription factor [Leptolyngbyaceae cyanobacterium SM1_3_5]|nr:response regulator transcription factor [Leptolyngbyaceae cyanobacterium SM1_3_5]
MGDGRRRPWKIRALIDHRFEIGAVAVAAESSCGSARSDRGAIERRTICRAAQSGANDSSGTSDFSAQDRSIDRVAAVQFGGKLFLQKPMSPTQVLRSVMDLLQPASQPIASILAVDADAERLALLKTILEPQGLQLTCLADAAQFWEHLKAVQPDLLILDVDLPIVSGANLCQSVRQDSQWNWLPIVFLAAGNDAATVQQVFQAGADDCLFEPIDPAEISLRVLNRLKRSQLLRAQAETDVLTGIANRQQATQAF